MHLKLLTTLVITFLHLSPSSQIPTKHNFVLIHGSCHGAWSWYKLINLIESSGHNVTAIDLGGSGIDSEQVEDLRSISDYFKPFMKFMESVGEDERVIVVGHSFGGLAISKAMEIFPMKISVAVFVSASMPGLLLHISTLIKKTLNMNINWIDTKYTYDDGPNNPPTTITFGPLDLATKLYQLSPKQDWALATTLMRPLRLFSDEDMSKELVFTTRNYGSVKRVFIVCEQDKLADKDGLISWMIKKNPPHQVVEIEGSDHMVMMSKPIELCHHLLHIASVYDI